MFYRVNDAGVLFAKVCHRGNRIGEEKCKRRRRRSSELVQIKILDRSYWVDEEVE